MMKEIITKHGLGATIIPEGRPVAYASKLVNSTELNYAQIKEEQSSVDVHKISTGKTSL